MSTDTTTPQPEAPHVTPSFTAGSLPPLTPPDLNERGKVAHDWLRAMGFPARPCPIRSGVLSALHRDPFEFYLHTRLGIVPRTWKGDAKLRGSLYHIFMQYDRLSRMKERPSDYTGPWPVPSPVMAVNLEVERVLHVAASDLTPSGSLPSGQSFDRFESDLRDRASWAIMLGQFHNEFFPLPPHIEVLHVERLLTASSSALTSTAACRTDTILADHNTRTCWIEDHKSLSGLPTTRLKSLPFEMGTRLYRAIVEANAKTLSLPYPLVGFVHNLMQVPDIKFCDNDRDFTLNTSPFKSGPRKGTPRNEKVYTGEPKWSNYIARCRDWYTASGDYLNLRNEREINPALRPALQSWMRFDEPVWTEEFLNALRFCDRYCSCAAYPDLFPRTTLPSQYGRDLSPYMPFYETPIKKWPLLLHPQTGSFIIQPRDPSLYLENLA